MRKTGKWCEQSEIRRKIERGECGSALIELARFRGAGSVLPGGVHALGLVGVVRGGAASEKQPAVEAIAFEFGLDSLASEISGNADRGVSMLGDDGGFVRNGR